MAEIKVAAGDPHGDLNPFAVIVSDGGGESRHRVTVSNEDLERLPRSGESGEDFVRRCFEFLLEREPKEAILPEFDVAMISRYFPEFEKEITS